MRTNSSNNIDQLLERINPKTARNIVNLYRDIQTLSDGEVLRAFRSFSRDAIPVMIQTPGCLEAMIECGFTPAHVQMPRIFKTDLLNAIVTFHEHAGIARADKNILLPYVFLSEQVWIRGFESGKRLNR